jgi:hypothetical protein
MKWVFLLLNVFMVLKAAAQDQQPASKKIPPTLAGLSKTDKEKQQDFFVIAYDIDSLKQFLSEQKLDQRIISEYKSSNLLVIRSSRRIIDSIFIPSSLVRFIDIVRSPKEETIIDDFDLSTNKVNVIHDGYKTINGNGSVVSVKENRPDSNDIDLKGRFFSIASASPNITSHATIMSTIIAGGGNSYLTGKGVAWGADITSSNFATLLPDTDADYKQYSISVQNHSYGTGIENYYGADAAAYDASTISNPALLHVFSAGNSGDKASTAGPYAGISGFANLTGSFKMAKNIITVGAIDSLYKISVLSSRGPAHDGRIRPELVAFGQDGSSGAAALVSGTALLLQQGYKERNGGQLPASALIKSILLNSADDVGPKGIDYQSGYGNLNAYKAMQTLINKQYFSGSIVQGLQETHLLNLPANIHQLKITICWNDLPANANDSRSLINDIDLRLIHPLSGQSWQSWVLNSFPQADSLAKPPIREKDSLNNTEHITLDLPASGTYILQVNGYHIKSGSQPYYISYQWDSINQFEWQYPSASDHINANSMNTLRWISTIGATLGKLYYSPDAGNAWKVISENIDLNKSYYHWKAPDTFSTVIFKMIIGNQSFSSGTSTISSRLITGVGFNCADSFSIHWNKAASISSYTVYRLENKYMEPVQSTTDTSIILKKAANTSMQYAVATNIQGKTGIKSYTFNYATQGIGCYISSFLVDLLNNTGDIRLELGTTYNVKGLVIEKSSRDDFFPIQTVSDATGLNYSFTDTKLIKGGNRYRIKIILSNGQILYSQIETIYYLPGINYLVYPNPVKTNFQIVSKDIDDTELILYNQIGQQVLIKKITTTVQSIVVPHLKRGLYFIVIMQSDKKVYQGSIVIQ